MGKNQFMSMIFVFFLVIGFVYATPGTAVEKNKNSDSLVLSAVGGLQPVVTENGKISWSIDGLGSNVGSGLIQVQKPAGATVRKAYMAAASSGFSGYQILNSDITIDGSPVTWTSEIPSSISSYNYWSDVTSLVQSTIDAASPGIIDLTVTEANTYSIDGVVLIVIFDDPNQVNDNTIILAFGAQNIAGDTFAMGLADPIDTTLSGFALDMSLGISFGYQSSGQYSIVEINSQRLTTSAGGQDDGASENGGLITVGGIDDINANPADPFQDDSFGPRYDDELYDLIPFVNDGDVSIDAFTQNPSSDDNIFFAGFFLGSTTAISGEGVLLSPVTATNPIGTEHTVTATVQDNQGNPLEGVEVHFEITSGPNVGLTEDVLTDLDGKATFTYTGNVIGIDTIQASFYNVEQELVTSNIVTKEWVEDSEQCVSDLTLISGTVSNEEGPVEGEEVTITCTHDGIDTVKMATTLDDGSYQVVFSKDDCATGDTVVVDALETSNSGLVTNNCRCVVNLALVDITVPEMGIIAAGIALIGALAVFAFKRK